MVTPPLKSMDTTWTVKVELRAIQIKFNIMKMIFHNFKSTTGIVSFLLTRPIKIMTTTWSVKGVIFSISV